MASTACFMIVSRKDIPIYEAELGTALKKEAAARKHQFILHAALDIVQELGWTTSVMCIEADAGEVVKISGKIISSSSLGVVPMKVRLSKSIGGRVREVT